MADVSVTAANVLAAAGALKETGTAGVALTAGKVVYKDTADANKWKLIDVRTSDETAGGDGIAICLNDSAAGQPISLMKSGNINPGGTLTVGSRYFASEAGGMCDQGDMLSGDRVILLGIATTTSNLSMQPWVSLVVV